MRKIIQSTQIQIRNQAVNSSEDSVFSMLKSFATNHPKKFLCLAGATGLGTAGGYVGWDSHTRKMEEKLAGLDAKLDRVNRKLEKVLESSEKNSFNINELKMEFLRNGYFNKPSLSEIVSKGFVSQSQVDQAVAIAMDQENKDEGKTPNMKNP